MEKNIKKAKVFLVGTCVEEQNKTMGETSEEDDMQFPIGITYLDAILKEKNYDILTKAYTIWSEKGCLEAIRKEVENFKPDFVGITMMSMTRGSSYKAIKIIKSINPNIKIILGGIHSSVMYEQLLKNFPIEAVCIGESENTLPELLDALMAGKSLRKIKGIAFNEKGKVIVTERRELIKNLDSLPFPSHDVFMNPKIKELQLVTSRGCPNRCSFCCLHITSRQVWRARTAKNVVDEIEYVLKKFPWLEKIQFVDDTMTLDNKRVIEICKEIIKRKIKFKFRCQGRIKPVSREMFYWMEKAGFVEIGFGIETGSKKLLESIHKKITREDCINTFNILKEFPKIRAVKFLMLGFPGETEETVRETINLVKELQKRKKMDFFTATPLWVYPGTEVYQLLKDKGKINDDFWLSDRPCPLFTLEHSEKWLIKTANKIAIESILAQGKIYFIKRLITKLINNPKYYFKRLLRITGNKEI